MNPSQTFPYDGSLGHFELKIWGVGSKTMWWNSHLYTCYLRLCVSVSKGRYFFRFLWMKIFCMFLCRTDGCSGITVLTICTEFLKFLTHPVLSWMREMENSWEPDQICESFCLDLFLLSNVVRVTRGNVGVDLEHYLQILSFPRKWSWQSFPLYPLLHAWWIWKTNNNYIIFRGEAKVIIFAAINHFSFHIAAVNGA